MRQIGQRKCDSLMPTLGGWGNSSVFFHRTDPVLLIDPIADSVGLQKFFASNVVAVNPVIVVLWSLRNFGFSGFKSSVCAMLGCGGVAGSLISPDGMTFLTYKLVVLSCRFQYKNRFRRRTIDRVTRSFRKLSASGISRATIAEAYFWN